MERVKRRRDPSTPIPAWWRLEDDGEIAHALTDTIEHLENISRAKREDDQLHMALYGTRNLAGMGAKVSRYQDDEKERVRFNVCAAVVDTLQAEIAQMRPKSRILTDRAEWGVRKKAQLFEAMIEGEFHRSDVYQLAPQVFVDASVIGDGYLKVTRGDGMPRVERVYPGEILVDPVDAAYNDPRTLYQLKIVDRQTLLDTYGDDETLRDAIERAPEANTKWFPWYSLDTLISPVLVTEAWHLSSSADADDGRHVIAIQDAVLNEDRAWERACFPFARLTWKPRQVGYYGVSLVEELRPIQRELNYVLMKIQECIHLGSGFRVLVEGNSQVNVEHLDNMPGSVLRYFGAIPPQTQVESTVPAELFAYADKLISRAFEMTGVSMLSATSQKPAGLNSGAALREHQDIESKRFVVKAQAYEKFLGVDLARLIIDEKRAIAEDGDEEPASVSIKRRHARVLKQVKWEDVDLDEDLYEVKVFPASALPKTPAGRMQVIEEWVAAGFVTREQAMDLHEIPDLDAYVDEQLSPRDIVLDAVDRMIEDGKYVPPEPIMNLEMARELVSLAYQRYRYQGVPDARLELLLRFIDDVDALKEQMQQPQQPAPAEMQGAPPGPPGPPGPPQPGLPN